mmetsp:Transcript_138576/g.430984  ORF Transcript_138576/g.430984 Transcript_138576/m.430984 type:complete len:586 (+) Transcript_138576:217-1974(+)
MRGSMRNGTDSCRHLIPDFALCSSGWPPRHEEVRVHRQRIAGAALQGCNCLARRADDWLLVHVEARVHQAVHARHGRIGPHDLEVEAVALVHNLRPRRAVHMDDGWAEAPHGGGDLVACGHVAAGLQVLRVQAHVSLGGAFSQRHRREGHELCPPKPGVQCLAQARVCRARQERPMAERPGAELHGAVEEPDHPSGVDMRGHDPGEFGLVPLLREPNIAQVPSQRLVQFPKTELWPQEAVPLRRGDEQSKLAACKGACTHAEPTVAHVGVDKDAPNALQVRPYAHVEVHVREDPTREADVRPGVAVPLEVPQDQALGGKLEAGGHVRALVTPELVAELEGLQVGYRRAPVLEPGKVELEVVSRFLVPGSPKMPMAGVWCLFKMDFLFERVQGLGRIAVSGQASQLALMAERLEPQNGRHEGPEETYAVEEGHGVQDPELCPGRKRLRRRPELNQPARREVPPAIKGEAHSACSRGRRHAARRGARHLERRQVQGSGRMAGVVVVHADPAGLNAELREACVDPRLDVQVHLLICGRHREHVLPRCLLLLCDTRCEVANLLNAGAEAPADSDRRQVFCRDTFRLQAV